MYNTLTLSNNTIVREDLLRIRHGVSTRIYAHTHTHTPYNAKYKEIEGRVLTLEYAVRVTNLVVWCALPIKMSWKPSVNTVQEDSDYDTGVAPKFGKWPQNINFDKAAKNIR